MATWYLDSSALVKLYVPEAGSAWVHQLVHARDAAARPSHVIALSRIGVVEISAAVARRARQGQLSEAQRDRLLAAFEADCRGRFFTLGVLDDQLRLAAALTRRQPLRAYDAVQLAAALDLDVHLRGAGLAGLTFVSADRALCAAARAEGLATEDPGEHDGG